MNQEFNQWVSSHLQSQQGKIAIVTGGNAGIGYYTAMGLAKVGAQVIIAGRNEAKLKDAVSKIEKEDISGRVSYGIMDLSSLDSVKSFAEKFKDEHDRLDILINNAGVMMPPEATTEEGYELQFGVNFLGHFLLTQLLYDPLKHTQASRVVSLSSIAHRMGHIDFDNLRLEKPYNPRREYYQSKLANLVFALELGRRVEQNGDHIISVACHPGFTKTELQRHLDPELLTKMTFMDTWQGALPSLLAATKEGVKAGEYYGPDGPGEIHGFPALGVIEAHAFDKTLGKKLWEVGEQHSIEV